MRKTFQRLQQRLGAVSGRIERRFQRTRTGTVLIMVVGLLVLLALMGTAFIATARIDRLSAGNMKQLTGLQEIADGLATQALSTAGTWIATDPQTFTSQSVDVPAGGTTSTTGVATNLNGPMWLASSVPSLFGPTGQDALMIAATKVTNDAAFVAWSHITQPIGYAYFISPITAATPALDFGSTSPSTPLGPVNGYDLGPMQYLMVPTNVVISYPQKYTNSDLAGRTWSFPAFYRLSQTTGAGGSSEAAPVWQKDGPFLAADATGDGVADSGLVPLDMPPTQGVTWYAAWRIVDNAAKVNVNTAFGPQFDQDASNNSLNYFPTDIDLLGMLGAPFNVAMVQFPNGFGELFNINYRRFAYYDNFSFTTVGPQTYVPFDDANVAHNDFQFATDAEAFWTSLGRRVDNPFYFTVSGKQARAGDPLSNFQRPFDESDTGAIGYRGVMVQSDGASGKFEQIEANRSATASASGPSLIWPNPAGNQQGDSVYGSAANYMNNSNSYFKFFEPNQVAYWYDWNFNFDYPYDWQGVPAHSATTGLTIYNGPSSVAALSKMSIGNQLGNSGGKQMANQSLTFDFRTPRALLTSTSHVMGQVRMVDPVALATVAAGVGAWAMPALTSYNHKASLNTSSFGELWRAYTNVLNDFPSEDGIHAPIGRNATSTYYTLNVPGGIADGINAKTNVSNQCNPVQFRSCMRDPTLGSTASNGITCAQNNSAFAMDGTAMLCLRAACGAANILTLRDQHGMVAGTNCFIPNTYTPVTTAAGTTTTPQITLANVNGTSTVNVYGIKPQPFITEVFVSNDTSPHPEAVKQGPNPQGLVIVKLYNPYPYPLSLTNYGLAMVDRSNYATTGVAVQLMDTAGTNLASTATPPPQIPSEGYVVLTNYNSSTGYWPLYLGNPPDYTLKDPTGPFKYIEVDNLAQLIGGTGTNSGFAGAKSYELLLLAPPDAAGTMAPEVPVDCFDFSGFPPPIANAPAGSMFTAWHYVRLSGVGASTSPGNPVDRTWGCVYPGPYSGVGFAGGITSTPATGPGSPHYGCDVEGPYTAGNEPWVNNTPALKDVHFDLSTSGGGDSGDESFTSTFPGIQLCNVDFGGYNKLGTKQYPSGVTSPVQFPWGGFARVGDAVQAPYIAAYVIASGKTVSWPPPMPAAGSAGTIVTVAEVNPVTIDSSLVDDGDVNDDSQEQLGRCVPIVDATHGIDDYSMAGVYSFAAPLTATSPAMQDLTIMPGLWRYHFALELFNQFTVVSNPETDYLPNMAPASWAGTATVPYPVSNTTGVIVTPTSPVGSEDAVPSEGLINVNTASWRVLAALELYPRSQDATGAINEQIAQAIVHYRDVDDGVVRYTKVNPPGSSGAPWTNSGTQLPPRGHGPFNSILELNEVYDYTQAASTATQMPGDGRFIYTKTIQNGWGAFTNLDFSLVTNRHNWGDYTPGPNQPSTGNLPSNDWTQQYLMVNRLSNLLTTRSDSFTVYVVVQGWRNMTTVNGTAASGSLPELVVERRMAATIDRSGIVHNSGKPKVVQFTTK